MTDNSAQSDTPRNEPEAETASTNTEGASEEVVVQTGTTEASEENLQEQLEEARAKANENWERYVRATAEQDNIRKRAERDIEHARKFALEKFAKDIIAVLDSLDLGLKSAEQSENAESAGQAVIEGVKLTHKIFIDALSKHGVTRIEAQGETFDPARHEAMSAVPSPDHAPNTIIEVIQVGYLLNERVLRPAMVIVAQAPPSA